MNLFSSTLILTSLDAAVGIFGGDLLEHRRELLARPAPFGPEIEDDERGHRRLDDVVAELLYRLALGGTGQGGHCCSISTDLGSRIRPHMRARAASAKPLRALRRVEPSVSLRDGSLTLARASFLADLSWVNSNVMDGGPITRLTEKQRACLRLVQRHYTSKQIARELGDRRRRRRPANQERDEGARGVEPCRGGTDDCCSAETSWSSTAIIRPAGRRPSGRQTGSDASGGFLRLFPSTRRGRFILWCTHWRP